MGLSSIKILGIVVLLIQLTLTNLSSARQIDIGPFTTKYAHDLDSGRVILLDTKRVMIQSFKYDGKGPDAWFQVKQRDNPNTPYSNPKERDNLSENPKIPDEKGSCDLLKAYTGKEDVILTLPSNLTWTNVEYLAVYCYKYTHNFGYINIPHPQNLQGLDEFPSGRTVPSFCSGATATAMNAAGLVVGAPLILVFILISRMINQ